MSKTPGLSVNEWAVLGALSTSATHGFAAARELASDGRIGRIWTVSRPLVYRAISTLLSGGMVLETGTEPGSAGPERRLLRVSPAGRRALRAWLETPVGHVRDYRSELMLKLLLLEDDPARRAVLVRAQRTELEPMCIGLERQLAAASGFEAVLVRWRLATALAARDFLEALVEPADAALT